jgi:hypothetical protein
MQSQFTPITEDAQEPSVLPCEIKSNRIEPILSAIKDYAKSQPRLLVFVSQTSVPGEYQATISGDPTEKE